MSANGKNGAIAWNRYGYRINNGDLYKRVSTIKGKLSKGDVLTDWAAKQVAAKVQGLVRQHLDGALGAEELLVALQDPSLANAHNETKEAAADFGTIFHTLAENVAAGDQDALHVAERELDRAALIQLAGHQGTDLKNERAERLFEQRLTDRDREALAQVREALQARLWPDVEAFLDWCDAWQPKWIRNEFQVFSDRLMVAGSVDALADVGGARLIIDHKTSKGVYADYGMQLAAYRYSDYIGEPDGSRTPMPETDGGAILHIRDGKCTLLEIPCGQREYEAFEACHRLYWWDRDVKPAKAFEPRLSLSVADALEALA